MVQLRWISFNGFVFQLYMPLQGTLSTVEFLTVSMGAKIFNG